jgi:hypothetical protein
MPRSRETHPVLPADWTDVLGRVQQTLEQARAEAEARAEALAAPPAADGEPPWRRGLGQARQGVDGLAACADRAARDVAEVDAVLAAGEDALRQWLAASEAARRKLAEWVGRAIG